MSAREGWPYYVNNPFTGKGRADRLRNAVKRLNEGQNVREFLSNNGGRLVNSTPAAEHDSTPLPPLAGGLLGSALLATLAGGRG